MNRGLVNHNNRNGDEDNNNKNNNNSNKWLILIDLKSVDIFPFIFVSCFSSYILTLYTEGTFLNLIMNRE
jgi:hypothetical protein